MNKIFVDIIVTEPTNQNLDLSINFTDRFIFALKFCDQNVVWKIFVIEISLILFLSKKNFYRKL